MAGFSGSFESGDLIFINPSSDIFSTATNFHPKDAFGDEAPKGNWRAFKRFGSRLPARMAPELKSFEKNALYSAMKSVFLLNNRWDDTEFFQGVMRSINRGEVMWGCKTEQEFRSRLTNDIPNLLKSLAQNGYMLQTEFIESSRFAEEPSDPKATFKIGKYYDKTDKYNEIKVGIGHRGEIIFLEGQHRLASARLLQLPVVPALVVFRHESWDELRQKVAAAAVDDGASCHIDHPDLACFGLNGRGRATVVRQLLGAGLCEVPIRISQPSPSPEPEQKGRDRTMQYLTNTDYLKVTSDLGGGHWSNAKRRWVYHAAAVSFARLSKPESPTKVLEMGTMGINIVPGSHTIDYADGWNFRGKTPTHPHDGRNTPWPIKDDQYDVFIALRVYHHLAPKQKEAFLEAKRIAKNIIIVAPESYNKVPGSKGIPLNDLIAWNGGVEPTAMMEFGEEFGNLYYWDESSLGKS